jgi:hypothetical protein
MSSDMTGPGRGVGARVAGFSASAITSPFSSSTFTDGARVSSAVAVTCSSNVMVAPAIRPGKLKVRVPSWATLSSVTAGPVPMTLYSLNHVDGIPTSTRLLVAEP